MKHIMATMLWLVLLAHGGSCLGRTWVVDQGGAGDFLWVKEALTAAGPGDTILINPGNYDEYDGPREWFTVVGKPLTLVGRGTRPEDTALRLGVHFRDAGGECRVENLLFYGEANNLVTEDGLVVRNCRFENNESDYYDGAALRIEGRAIVEDCVFVNNRALGNLFNQGRGGAIHAYRYGGDPEHLEVRRCIFIRNEAAYRGGAIYAVEPLIEDCVFYRNKADRGGALLAGECASISGCTFLENEVRYGLGAAIEACTSGSDRITHCIIARTVNGYGIGCLAATTVECCDIWMNDFGNFMGQWCDPGESQGNFSADPLFCDEARGDIGLLEGSPCLPGQHGTVQCGLIGARGLGCTGPIRVERLSWGKIRALYR